MFKASVVRIIKLQSYRRESRLSQRQTVVMVGLIQTHKLSGLVIWCSVFCLYNNKISLFYTFIYIKSFLIFLLSCWSLFDVSHYMTPYHC